MSNFVTALIIVAVLIGSSLLCTTSALSGEGVAAAAFGGLCPSVTYIVVTMVTLWWVIPEKPQK